MVDLGLPHMAASIILCAFTVVFTSLMYYLRKFFTNTELSVAILVVFSLYILLGFILEKKRLRRHKNRYSDLNNRHTSEDSGEVKITSAAEVNPKLN